MSRPRANPQSGSHCEGLSGRTWFLVFDERTIKESIVHDKKEVSYMRLTINISATTNKPIKYGGSTSTLEVLWPTV